MTFNTLYRFGLFLVTVIQMIIVLGAEHNEEYTRATYEMLWLFFFLLLCHWEFDI